MSNESIESRCRGLVHAINQCSDRDYIWKQDMKDLVHTLRVYHRKPQKISREVYSQIQIKPSPLIPKSWGPGSMHYRVRDLVGKEIHIGTTVAFYWDGRMMKGSVIGINRSNEMQDLYKCRVEEIFPDELEHPIGAIGLLHSHAREKCITEVPAEHLVVL